MAKIAEGVERRGVIFFNGRKRMMGASKSSTRTLVWAVREWLVAERRMLEMEEQWRASQ